MEELRPQDQVDSAAWVSQSLASTHDRVSGLVPSGFDGYARILHRATGPDGSPTRWGRVARAENRQVHALAQFAQVARRAAYDSSSNLGWPGENPTRGSLDEDQLHALLEVLIQCSNPDAECILLLWEGWGNLPTRWKQPPNRATQSSREYFIFRARLDQVEDVSVHFALPQPVLEQSTDLMRLATAPQRSLHNVQSPNQWWPIDKSWFVATEVDQDSTVVGGPSFLIRQIAAHPILESYPILFNDYLGSDSDRTNPPVAGR